MGFCSCRAMSRLAWTFRPLHNKCRDWSDGWGGTNAFAAKSH
jgi:hypothetical protein